MSKKKVKGTKIDLSDMKMGITDMLPKAPAERDEGDEGRFRPHRRGDYDSRGGFDRDSRRDEGSWSRGSSAFDGPRGGGGFGGGYGGGGGYSRDPPPAGDRPRLNLKPRSVPSGEGSSGFGSASSAAPSSGGGGDKWSQLEQNFGGGGGGGGGGGRFPNAGRRLGREEGYGSGSRFGDDRGSYGGDARGSYNPYDRQGSRPQQQQQPPRKPQKSAADLEAERKAAEQAKAKKEATEAKKAAKAEAERKKQEEAEQAAREKAELLNLHKASAAEIAACGKTGNELAEFIKAFEKPVSAEVTAAALLATIGEAASSPDWCEADQLGAAMKQLCAGRARDKKFKQMGIIHAVQATFNTLGFPRNEEKESLVQKLFYALYNADIVEEDGFQEWRYAEDDDTPGKQTALIQCNDFLLWLDEPAPEDEEEEEEEEEEPAPIIL